MTDLRVIHDRIDRAEEHFATIKVMTRDYFNSGAYSFAGDYDPDTRQIRVRKVASAPDIRLTTIVGEAIHNLRSALDHLAWELVVAEGGKPTKNTAFPVLEVAPRASADNLHGLPTVDGGLSEDAARLIAARQPYALQSDDPLIAAFNPLLLLTRLWNIDKHRHIPIGGLLLDDFRPIGPLPAVHSRWHSEIAGATPYRAQVILRPDDPTVDVYAEASAFVVFQEPPRHPASVPATIGGAVRFVRDLVAEAETSCFR